MLKESDIDEVNVEFSKIVWFNFGIGEEVVDSRLQEKEHISEVWVRYTHDISEKPRKISFQKRSNVHFNLWHLPSSLYTSKPLPVKSAKASDLRKLAMDYIPSTAKSMYMNIPPVESTSTYADDD